MTRVLLLILAVIEAALGMFGLIGAINLLLSHAAGMTLIFLPVLAIVALLLVASAAIFIRKPWSYYTHIAVIVLMGILLAIFVFPLVGTDGVIVLLPAGLVIAALTVLFLLPPVRRYFGM